MVTITDITINAERFELSHDVDDAISAMTYDVEYEPRGTTEVFDPTFFNTLRLYDGRNVLDQVRIKGTVDGITDQLVLGIVDRNGWTDREGGSVAGRIQGRDLAALILDSHPTKIFAFPVGSTFYASVRTLAAKAGLAGVQFFCRNYIIGTTYPVNLDRTLVAALQDLLTPLRWSEKHRTDAWVDNNILTVAERNYTNPARGTITVDAARIIVDRFEKTRLISVDDVRVEGARFKIILTDPNASTSTTVTNTRHVDLTDPKNGAVVESFDETLTIVYDAFSRVISTDRLRTYLIRGGAFTVRFEHESATNTFWADDGTTSPANLARRGKEKEHTSFFDITDEWSNQVIATERVSSIFSTADYWERFGNAKSIDRSETLLDQDSPSPLAIKSKSVESTRWYYSGKQVIQEKTLTTFNPDGSVSSTNSTRDIGAFDVTQGAQTTAGANQQVLESQFFAGPAVLGPLGFQGILRREQSDMLGSNADCAGIRTDLIDEHVSIKVGISLRMPFDFRIRPGKLLVVQNAPSWWPITQFYITAMRISAGDGFLSDVEALAWV